MTNAQLYQQAFKKSNEMVRAAGRIGRAKGEHLERARLLRRHFLNPDGLSPEDREGMSPADRAFFRKHVDGAQS